MSRKENTTGAIYSAPWILPIAGPAIRDGAVAVRDGRIEATGPVAEIRAAFPGREAVACGGLLMPALINAHIHLELSHLGDVPRPAAPGRICGWIEALLGARGECTLSADERAQRRRMTLAEQHRSGVVLMADIGNDASPPLPEDRPLVRYFQEFLAPTQAAADAALAALSGLPDGVSATAHACYSTLPELIRALKERTARLEQVFPMHIAESAEEIEFIRSHSGPFRTFLEGRGAWDGSFLRATARTEGLVSYLQGLGVLDARTLCVHCVHIREDELKMLAAAGSHVCLCPGSNRFLRVGRAPLETMLRCGLLPAIGTDSIASNDALDLWAEMRILRDEHPSVEPGKILAMATLGGAAALHCEGDFGSLMPRKRAVFLQVGLEKNTEVDSELELYDILTGGGRPPRIDWIGCV